MALSAEGAWPVHSRQRRNPAAGTSMRSMRSCSDPVASLGDRGSDSDASHQASLRVPEPIAVPGAPIEPAGQWLNQLRPGAPPGSFHSTFEIHELAVVAVWGYFLLGLTFSCRIWFCIGRAQAEPVHCECTRAGEIVRVTVESDDDGGSLDGLSL